MKNLIFIGLLTLVASLNTINAQTALAVNHSPEKATEALIEWDHTTFDFGEIPQGTPVEASFTLTNKSDQPLLLEGVKPSCGCTVASYDQEPILPGASTIIKTTYNAKANGNFQKNVKVSTNLNDQPILLKLKGKVTKAE